MPSTRPPFLAASAAALCASAALAGGEKATARSAMQLFAEHCFSPYLTADKARRFFALSGASYDFYDLDPFTNAAPSPPTGAAATPGSDRRCEIAFAGNHAEAAAEVAVAALEEEGIVTEAPLPARYEKSPGTTLLAARHLTPRRVAVVQVGTRPAPAGSETFMRVERLQEGASE